MAGDTEAEGDEEEKRSWYTGQQRPQIKVGLDCETEHMQ